MPTIIVDKAKGLYQKAATSANPAGSLSGQKDVVKVVNGAAALTELDSGKTILVQGDGGNITFPAVKGWHATFVITGALDANAVITGSAGYSESTFQGRTLVTDTGTITAVTIGSTAGVTFVNSAATAGDSADIVVLADGGVVHAITRQDA
jgi:hypothetical protein